MSTDEDKKLPPIVDELKRITCTDELSDCHLKLSDGSLPAHGLILALSSSRWKKEVAEKVAEVDFSKATVAQGRSILQFLYGGELELKESEVSPFLELAKEFDITALKVKCGSQMTGLLSIDSALRLFTQAPELVGDPKWGLGFIAENTEELLEQSAFLDLPKDRLKVLLSCDELGITEAMLFTKVIEWGKAEAKRTGKGSDTESLKAVLADILPLIRFPAMEPAELASVVTPTELVDGETLVKLFMYTAVEDEKTREGIELPFNKKARQVLNLGTWDPSPAFTHNLYDVDNKGRTCRKARDGSYIYVLREMQHKRKPTWTVRLRLEATGNSDSCDRVGIATGSFRYDEAYVHGNGAIGMHSSGTIYVDGGGSTSSYPGGFGSVGQVISLTYTGSAVIFQVDKGQKVTVNWPGGSNQEVFVCVSFRNLNWSWSFII